ncbi:MAG TPA: glycoside hydrolase family 76 protein [Chloroflexota bacterium]|jgi:uncharacterized protein YyaL (SSP411 family)
MPYHLAMRSESAAALYLQRARATHAYTMRRLAYYGGARDADAAPWLSYRRSTAEPDYSDTWYDFSQLLADAALAACGLPVHIRYAAQAFRHLERHWDAAAGGYFARGSLRGDHVDRPDKYADDNALAGVVLLHAHASAPDPVAPDRYLARAVAIAEYLAGHLWDDVFGGGFWWNTRRGDGVEGKPAQANGLAALLFLRLRALTGDPRWGDWAARTLAWLDANLWDADAGLYQYSVRYADLAARRGRVVERRYFNYDQAILIEALVQRARDESDGASLARARTIADHLEGAFWDAALGGYVLEAGVPQLYLVYAAWLTPALLDLAAADRDPRWLTLARRNVDTLHARLYDPGASGYAHRAWRDGAHVRLDPERHTGAQAWMQYAQARLALALAGAQ